MKRLSWNQKESGLIDSCGDMLEYEIFCLLTLLVAKRTGCRKQMDKHACTT